MTFGRGAMDSASSECAARAIGSMMREAAANATNPDLLAVEAERLRRTVVQTRPTHKSRSPTRLALAAAAFVTVVVGGYVAFERPEAPLWVEARTGGASESGSFIRVGTHHLAAPDSGSSELRFSDGSRATVETGARLRVQELFSNGASLLLEKGRANIQVVHRGRDTRWNVAAGPFSVAVVGTRFDIAWNPATEQIRVDLHEGRVEIHGPKYASPATLMSGQRFEALASVAGWSVTPLGIASALKEGRDANTDPVPAQKPPLSETTESSHVDAPVVSSPLLAVHKGLSSRATDARRDAVAAAPSTVGSVAPVVEGRQWSKLVASGEFKQVTREADTLGLMVCLSHCSASDLRALADASRYTGRLDTAEAALRVLHDRYPAQASSAAYLLGAVDEARGRNVSALRWYDEYLSRTTSGGFIAEARAARLRMLVATGGNGAARQAAREYLEQYPRGAAAGLATKVLEGR